jgi:hypothetical protein
VQNIAIGIKLGLTVATIGKLIVCVRFAFATNQLATENMTQSRNSPVCTSFGDKAYRQQLPKGLHSQMLARPFEK